MANLQYQFNPLILPKMQDQIKKKANGPFLFEKITQSQTKITTRNEQWTQQEKMRYLNFLIINQQELSNSQFKEIKQYFPLMAKHIKSRNWNQCRIYHQRMLKKYHAVSFIINALSLKEPSNTKYSLFSDEWPQNYEKQVNIKAQEYQNIELGQIFSKQEFEYQAFNLPLTKRFENIDSIQMNEKDEKIIPTDVTYRQQMDLNPKQRVNFNQPKQPPKPFNTTLPFPPLQSRYIPPDFTYFHPFLTPFSHHLNFRFPPPSISSKFHSQWMECHQLFVLWTSKLSHLLREESK